jgi:hypothetical protein
MISGKPGGGGGSFAGRSPNAFRRFGGAWRSCWRSTTSVYYYNTNIELALLNAYFVGKSLYPDRFKDINMEEKAGEIMKTFLGIRPDREIPAYRKLRFPEAGPVEWR